MDKAPAKAAIVPTAMGAPAHFPLETAVALLATGAQGTARAATVTGTTVTLIAVTIDASVREETSTASPALPVRVEMLCTSATVMQVGTRTQILSSAVWHLA